MHGQGGDGYQNRHSLIPASKEKKEVCYILKYIH